MTLYVTPGDPRGIGPEIVARALAARRPPDDVVVIGDPVVLDEARRHGLRWDDRVRFEAPPSGAAPVEIRAIEDAVARLNAAGDRRSALVTGPIHKGRLHHRGFPFTGHTDLLGHLCGVDEPVMAFVGGKVRVVLVTVHVPLARVSALITPERVLRVVRTAWRALREDLGLSAPRLWVCGLNPHAGDDGALGDEDRTMIAPAVAAARAEGIDAVGPVSAEHAFIAAQREPGEHMVVAMYHDQGLAPLKALDFGHSVNWTLGLPIHRTSVDHGTADDLVGMGVADTRSMHAALDLATALTAR